VEFVKSVTENGLILNFKFQGSAVTGVAGNVAYISCVANFLENTTVKKN